MKIYTVFARFSDMCNNEEYIHYGTYWAESDEEVKTRFVDGAFQSWYIEESVPESLPTSVVARPSIHQMRTGRYK